METIYITNDPWRAQVAERAGVDRIMVDLEIMGKRERQPSGNTVISAHSINDIRRVRATLNRSRLLARINPPHDRMEGEIRDSIEAGADTLMLPMFSDAQEVSAFIRGVRGRAKTCLLLETAPALARIRDILETAGIDEVHIGLNDLHLALKLDFMFEIVSGGLADYMAQVVHQKGIKLGIGGVARLGQGLLGAELVLSEHVRLGSTLVILSRDFGNIFNEHPAEAAPDVFRHEVQRLHAHIEHLRQLPPADLEANSRTLQSQVAAIATQIAARRQGRAAVPPSS